MIYSVLRKDSILFFIFKCLFICFDVFHVFCIFLFIFLAIIYILCMITLAIFRMTAFRIAATRRFFIRIRISLLFTLFNRRFASTFLWLRSTIVAIRLWAILEALDQEIKLNSYFPLDFLSSLLLSFCSFAACLW